MAQTARSEQEKPLENRSASGTRAENEIYGKNGDTPLTMDVFRPAVPANGAGVILIVSGGWASSRGAINPKYAAHFLKRGYTVFAVVHGSNPKVMIPEIIPDLHRAVRFIRYHARDYPVDPQRLGVTGASSGGHLSLIIHGEKDQHVLLHQSTSFVDAATRAGGTAKLIVKSGKPHGWLEMGEDVEQFADWFDVKLRKVP